MFKAVFFDLNGVLIESEFLSKRFEEKSGVPNEEFVAALKEIMAVVRKPNAPAMYSLWEPYFEKWGVSLTEEEFLNFWFYGESVNEAALSYVQELKEKGIKVFVVSNNFRERTAFYRSHFPQIFQNLDGAYFSWETGFVKPSREALEFVLSEHNLEPSDVIFFDDGESNVAVAKELGIDGQLWPGLEEAKKYIASK